MSNLTPEARKTFDRNRYQKRWNKVIELLGGVCVKCGATADLQIDHIDPTKKSFTITDKLAGGRWDIIEGELQKCQLLCREHHREKTLSERTGPRLHGTPATYYNGKCRCRICKDWFNAYKRDLRRRKKNAAIAQG